MFEFSWVMEAKLCTVVFLALLGSFNALPVFDKKNGDGVDGEYGTYYQGDMILDYDQMSSILYPDKRNGLVDEKYRWPGNIVFYEIDSTFDEKRAAYITEALRKIEEVTCIRFKPRTKKTKDYIHVTGYGAGCYSNVGHHGGKQIVNLAKYPIGVMCFRQGSIIHEFIHALGFYHQQSASNRDEYVTIIKENILEGREQNFFKYPSSMLTDFEVPYDYGSIMHYGPKAFSKNGEVTIATIDKNAQIGQRKAMSNSDIKKINLMYKCQK